MYQKINKDTAWNITHAICQAQLTVYLFCINMKFEMLAAITNCLYFIRRANFKIFYSYYFEQQFMSSLCNIFTNMHIKMHFLFLKMIHFKH